MAKKGRRAKGEGTIFQRKDGRWVAELKLEDGRRKPFYGKTQAEALEKRQQAWYEQKQGILATGPKQTVRQYLEYWLENVHRPPIIRISTYEGYRVIIKKHVLPAIGHIQIQKLTTQTVQSFYARRLKEGVSAKRVRAIHGVLHTALEHAVRISLIPRNVCDFVELPRREGQREIHPLTPEQAQMFVQSVREHHLETLLMLALTTGMRKGEILGIRWKDIDMQKGTLQVRRTLGYIAHHGFVEGEPKSLKGKRQIVLPQFVIEALKRHRALQLEARLKAGAAWIDSDLVFCNSVGRFIVPMTLSNHFAKLLKEIGLPAMHFHDLRHSAATLLLSMGVHPKVVQELLGHSTMSVTMDIYSHALPSMQREAMNKMDDLLRQQSGDLQSQ